MTLGETIKILRTEKALTQPELAEKARIEQVWRHHDRKQP